MTAPLLCKDHGSPFAFAGIGMDGEAVLLVCIVGQEVFEVKHLEEGSAPMLPEREGD